VLLILPLLGIYGALKQSLDSRMLARRLTSDVRYLPSPQATAFLAIGYKPAMADLTWIEALNYFGTEIQNKQRTYKYIDGYLQIILKLDPLFRMFYEWAATIFIYNGLPITQKGLIESTRYVNRGIQALASKGIFDEGIMAKGAFNFAFEAHDYENSIPYFELTARSSPSRRDFLLIGSTYARHAGDDEKATKLRLEFLAFAIFESQSQDEINSAIKLLTSRQFDAQAAGYARSFRLQMEKDEQVKKLIETRFASSPMLRAQGFEEALLPTDPRLENLLKINTARNWIPADLHLLLSL